MLSYIAIGVLIMFGIEVSMHTHKEEISLSSGKELKFNLFERAIIILLWPITLGGVIKNFINQYK
jgi:hypothetical protein|tara:strand:- start:295 stop:489 length:195 start_codon:yes stop_codon:yes gene_type:complete